MGGPPNKLTQLRRFPHDRTPTECSGVVLSTTFAYRELGPQDGIPLVLLNHWGAVLDNFDPRIVDGLARKHRVIAIDYRGIGSSGGIAPVTVDDMARDTIALIRAMGLGESIYWASRSAASWLRTWC